MPANAHRITAGRRVVNARVLYDHQESLYASDHFPVVTTLEWTAPGTAAGDK